MGRKKKQQPQADRLSPVKEGTTSEEQSPTNNKRENKERNREANMAGRGQDLNAVVAANRNARRPSASSIAGDDAPNRPAHTADQIANVVWGNEEHEWADFILDNLWKAAGVEEDDVDEPGIINAQWMTETIERMFGYLVMTVRVSEATLYGGEFPCATRPPVNFFDKLWIPRADGFQKVAEREMRTIARLFFAHKVGLYDAMLIVSSRTKPDMTKLQFGIQAAERSWKNQRRYLPNAMAAMVLIYWRQGNLRIQEASVPKLAMTLMNNGVNPLTKVQAANMIRGRVDLPTSLETFLVALARSGSIVKSTTETAVAGHNTLNFYDSITANGRNDKTEDETELIRLLDMHSKSKFIFMHPDADELFPIRTIGRGRAQQLSHVLLRLSSGVWNDNNGVNAEKFRFMSEAFRNKVAHYPTDNINYNGIVAELVRVFSNDHLQDMRVSNLLPLCVNIDAARNALNQVREWLAA